MTNLLIIAALLYVPFSTVAWQMRRLTKAGIDYRLAGIARDTMVARHPKALRGFMRIAPRTMPRIASHAPYVTPWDDMAQSIYDDAHMDYCN